MEGKVQNSGKQSFWQWISSAVANYPLTFYVGIALLMFSGLLLWLHFSTGLKLNTQAIMQWVSANETVLLIVATLLLSVVLISSGVAYRKVVRLSKEDYAIWLQQRSTKTLFPFFTPLHDWLRMRVAVYRWWHTQTYANPIHTIILIAFTVFTFINIQSQVNGSVIVASYPVSGSTSFNFNSCVDVAGNTAWTNASNATTTDGSLATNTFTSTSSSVTYDASSSGSGSTATVTFSHTVGSNSNRLLTVGIADYGGSISGVTYNGVAMTVQAIHSTVNLSKTDTAQIYYLINPPSGAHNIVVTQGTVGTVNAGGISFYNVDQTTPFGTNVSTGSKTTSGTLSTSVTSSSTGMVVDAASIYGTGVLTSGNTERWSGGTGQGSGSTEAGASTVSMSYSFTGGAAQDMVSTPINAVSGGSVISTADYIKCTQLSSAIPSNATITGVGVNVLRKSSVSTTITDQNFYLVKGGTIETGWTNKASGTNWPTTLTSATYGGSADLWGGTLTAADVNAADFGVALKPTSSAAATASVDSITGTIYYTTPADSLLSVGDVDGFNTIDSNTWTTVGTLAPTISSGRLNAQATTATSAWSAVKLNRKLHGDFDVRVDYDNTQQPTPASGTSEKAVLQVSGSSYNYSNFAYKDSGGNYSYSNYQNQTASTFPGNSVPGDAGTTSSTGTLRFVRTGSTIYAYVLDQGAWYLTGTQTGADTSDVTVYVFAQNSGATGQAAHAYFDNFSVQSGTLASVTAGNATTVGVMATDNNGLITTNYTGTVHFTSSDPQAVLPSDYTFTGSDSGFHQFTSGITLKTDGTQTVTATDTVTGVTVGTGTYSVNAASASQYVLTIPASTTAGTAFSPQVTVQDAYANTITSYTGTVHFTSGDTNATLPSDYTFVGGDNGTHTFTNDATLETSGSQTITASESGGSITKTSTTTVSPIDAVSLTVGGITSPTTAGSASNVVVTAYDTYGNVATGYTGTVSFVSSDSGATLPPDYTFVGGDNGTHTFISGVTFNTVGTQSVTATDTATSSITGSQSNITVDPAAATTYVWSTVPSSVAAGSAFTMTLTAQDAYGNTDTSYTGTAHFTSTDTQAVLPANYTFVGGDNGAHTFTSEFTLKTAGSKTITATDTVSSGINVTSSGITVNGASANTYVWSTVPSSVTAGSAFSATLTAKDTYGNTDTSYTGKAHFTSTDTQAVLPSDYTFVGGDAGVHTFTAAITMKTVGTQSLTATDTVSSSITGTQNNITVSPAAASVFELSSVPITTSAGTVFSMTLSAKDAYGNAATSYTGTAHFTSTDSDATLPSNYTFTGGDAGVHNFNSVFALSDSGSQTITVTDTITSSLTVTATITVTSTGADHFVLSSVPSSTTAGSSISPTLTVKDSSGNTLTSYTGTVQFISSDTQASLPTDYTFVAGDNGVHTFTNGVVLKTNGTQSLTVTDTANSSVTQTVYSTVTSSTALQYVLTMPTDVTAGTSFSARLTVEDAYANPASNYTGTAHFTSTDAGATLPVDYTFVSGDNGVHTFTNGMALVTAGGQTLTALDQRNSGLTVTAALTVNPASAAHYVMSSAPGTIAKGTTFGLTLTAQDIYGNTANGYTGTVHFTSSDAAAVLPSDYMFTTGDAGIHIFGPKSFALVATGSQNITATDTIKGSISAVATVTVSAEAIAAPTSPIPSSPTQPTSSPTGRIPLLDNGPARSVANTTVVVSSAIVAASLAPATSVIGTIATTNVLQGISIFNLPFFGFRRRRRKNWGKVKNSLTGLPLAGVSVELWSESNKLLGKMMTDRSGQFAFLVDKPGRFRIRVDNPLYQTFQSDIIAITDPKASLVKMDITLLPIEGVMRQRMKKALKLIKFTQVMYYIHWPLLILGSALAVVLLYHKYSTLYLVMAILYGVIWLIEIYQFRYQRPFGVVVDRETGQPQSLSVVQLTTEPTGQPEVVRSTITDGRGRFLFVVKPDKYKLVAAKQGFLPEQKEIKDGDINLSVKLTHTVDSIGLVNKLPSTSGGSQDGDIEAV